MSVDKFWSNDVTVLFNKDKLSEFFPTNTMSIEEVLNALVRASLYLSICLFVYKRNVNVFFISIGTLVITYLIYKYSPTLKGNNKGYNENKNSKHGSESKRGEEENTEGFESRYESDEFLQDKVCVTPTVNNPFMNVAISDYKNMPNREVCDDLLDNPHIKQDIESKFNHGLYQDVGDIWGRTIHKDNSILCQIQAFQINKKNLHYGYTISDLHVRREMDTNVMQTYIIHMKKRIPLVQHNNN